MSQLTYGKINQVSFANEQEKQAAFDYLCDNFHKWYVEPNDTSGAWAEEYRIYVGDDAPYCLKRQRTNGNRINCKELYEAICAIVLN